MDPKEMGIQPTEVGNPTKRRPYCTCEEPLTHSQQRIKENFKLHDKGMSRGEYLPRNLHLGRFPDNLSVALTQPEGQLSLTSKNKNFNYLFS